MAAEAFATDAVAAATEVAGPEALATTEPTIVEPVAPTVTDASAAAPSSNTGGGGGVSAGA